MRRILTPEDLRRAAKLLTDRADAATEGEWRVTHDQLGTHVETDLDHMGRIVFKSSSDRGPDRIEEDAAYIAMMHPPVAYALARLFTHEADAMERMGIGWYPPVTALARAVLRMED
jgi:hypothetical protein